MSRLAVARSCRDENTSRLPRRDRPAFVPGTAGVRPGWFVVFSIWLGLATGMLEVLALYARRHLAALPAVSALELNQHARWMIPLSHAMIFGVCGLVLAWVALVSGSRRWVGAGVYGLCFLSALSLLATYRGLTTIASMTFGAGATLWVAPCLLDHARRPTRLLRVSLPALLGLLGTFLSLNMGREKFNERWLPRAATGAPNVLLIVLDTVRAESLSFQGYGRPTSPRLAAFAARGVRFEHARTAAAWTLPSHATMFTGRWPHELSTRPDRPLDDSFPTLAEFLRDRGYATAGFAANTYFCSQWYGLGRGFMHYEDVALTPLEVLRSSIMGRYLVRQASLTNNSRPTAYFERKDAVTINGEVVNWLSNRPEGRPFFAFLNYYDAHDPYLVPPQAPRHFGLTPTSADDVATLRDWLRVVTSKLPSRTIELARDAYDDCIAYLDDQVGRLLSELDSRGLLENTLVVVTADHGELLGERGEFGHGQSLHHEVVRVPLLVVAPRRVPSGQVVAAPVSLRDLPATVVDLLGLAGESPFPGRSLARYWRSPSVSNPEKDEPILTETAELVSTMPIDAKEGRSLMEQNALYIRAKDGREELYDLATDPSESHDLSRSVEFQPLLKKLRAKLVRVDLEAEVLESLRRSARNGLVNAPVAATLPQRNH